MSAIVPEVSYLFDSAHNPRQKSSDLGFGKLNDPQRQESVQEMENAGPSSKGYGKCQFGGG